MKEEYELTPAQVQWANKRKHGISPSRLKELIKKQKGLARPIGGRNDFREGARESKRKHRGMPPTLRSYRSHIPEQRFVWLPTCLL